MSLPNDYVTYDEYFLDALTFLKDYQILYNYANTNILCDNVLKRCKSINIVEFNEKLHRLIPSNFDNNVIASNNKKAIIKGLSFKKQHEIHQLCELIRNECKNKNISSIIDLGCGLGYLSQLLNEFDLKVLGIEGDNKRVDRAIERQEKYFISSLKKVHYVNHFITEESVPLMLEYVNKYFSNESFMLTGLHACADLTIESIKLFISMESCKGIVIMPCCYHKMREKCGLTTCKMDGVNSQSSEEYINIPLSESMQKAYAKLDGSTFIKRPFLRLSCQSSQAMWSAKEQDKSRIFHLLSRAVLQFYAYEEKLRLVKKKRRAVSKLKSNECDFESFLQDALTYGYSFEKLKGTESNYDAETNRTAATSAREEADAGTSKKQDEKLHCRSTEVHIEHVRALWYSLTPDDFSAAELLLKLQDSMQVFCENFVLLDKLAYLNEQRKSLNSNMCFKFVKVTDEKISPRCFALVASK